jgi:hypothetical protein
VSVLQAACVTVSVLQAEPVWHSMMKMMVLARVVRNPWRRVRGQRQENSATSRTLLA